jgi:hypothetical protein
MTGGCRPQSEASFWTATAGKRSLVMTVLRRNGQTVWRPVLAIFPALAER